MDSTKIFDRQAQKLTFEKTYGEFFLKLAYGHHWFSKIFYSIFLPIITSFSFLSSFYGWLQKCSWSRRKIKPFIKKYEIDASEFEKPIDTFTSFNDFFIRKLKAGARPVVEDPNVMIAPADARYLVLPKVHNHHRFSIKKATFNLGSFLTNQAISTHFEGGSMVIARLCPLDYHRFHFPFDATIKQEPTLINGSLYSVSPWALKKRFSILAENKRVITLLDSPTFGLVAFVEIGATCVGTIWQTYTQNEVKKGDEKGYFSFGGSSIVMLFEPGRITFDEDLLSYSKQGIETVCKWGTRLGSI